MALESYLIFFSLISIILVQAAPLPEECSNQWLQNQDCSWYLNCLEQKYQCGPHGYPQGYGFKYCSKFSQLKSKADPVVVDWIEQTTTCLKQSLKHFLDNENKFESDQQSSQTCKHLKKAAFKSHPECYTSSGFCAVWKKLGLKRSAIFLDQLLSIFELKDFVSFIAIKQILVTLDICAKIP